MMGGTKDYLYKVNFREKVSPGMIAMAKTGKKSFGTILNAQGQVLRKFPMIKSASDKATTGLVSQARAADKLAAKYKKIPNTKSVAIKTPGLTNANRQIQQFDRGLFRVARNAALLAGLNLGLIGLGGATVGKQASLEKSLSNVKALTSSTTEEMTLLRAEAKRAGETTEHFATSSADAMGFLAMAGQSNAQILQSLKPTLDLASAGSIDLARAADIGTNIMSQYGKKASDTTEIVDKLASTQANANTNIYEISDAMNYWGPTAKALNVTLSESLATVAVLSNNGLKGSLATRALGTSISRLAEPSRRAKDVMKEYNLEFFDTRGNFVGMVGLVEELESKISHLNPKQKQAALTAIFQSEAIQELNILLSAGSDNLERFTKNLDQSEGAARRMAVVKLDNLHGDFTKLKSVTEAYGIQLGEELDPTLRHMTRISAMWVKSLDTEQAGLTMRYTLIEAFRLTRGMQKNWSVIKGVAKTYVLLRTVTFGYNLGLKAQAALVSANTARHAVMRSGLLGTAAASKTATVATQGLNTAVKFSPLGAAVSVVSTLASAYLLLRDNINKTTDAEKSLALVEEENKFKRQDHKKQVASAGKFLSLTQQPGLLENLSSVELQRKIQKGETFLAHFQDASLEARQFQKEADRSGLTIQQNELARLKEKQLSISSQSNAISAAAARSPVGAQGQIEGLRRLRENSLAIEQEIARVTQNIAKIRNNNPVLASDPADSTKQSKELASQIAKSIESLRKRLPASEDPFKTLLPNAGNKDLGDQISELSGSATGGSKRVQINFNIGDINNTVHAGSAEEGSDEIIDHLMERLLGVFNEAGLQVKLAISNG